MKLMKGNNQPETRNPIQRGKRLLIAVLIVNPWPERTIGSMLATSRIYAPDITNANAVSKSFMSSLLAIQRFQYITPAAAKGRRRE